MEPSQFERLNSWWRGPALDRFLRDLMESEFAHLRPDIQEGRNGWEASATTGEMLPFDSLERLKVANAVATALQFERAPAPVQMLNTFSAWHLAAQCVLEVSDGALAFKTSGSTGRPHYVVHGVDTLCQEIEALAALFSGIRRVLTMVPSHHIYGFLFTVVLPMWVACETVDTRWHDPASVAAMAGDGDLIVAFPTFWRAAAEAGIRWRKGTIGVTSGAPCATEVSTEVCRQGLGRFMEIYGATETGGIGWREQGAQAFRLFAHWTRVDAERIARAAVGNPLSSQVVELPDHVVWIDAHHLVPQGRRYRAVQVGGRNIYPERVRSALLAHELVADAQVRLMRPEEGERLKAFIVPRDPETDFEHLRRTLENWVEALLPTLERPRAYRFGMSLPQSERGKPDDWDILGV
jgi:long-chain acyl-CoA synthetase